MTPTILQGKPADAAAEIHELMRQRWSPRAFTDQPVSAEALRAMFEAARWAPSSLNEQPWSFVVADRFTDPAAHARIASTLVPANAAWAAHAPVLMVAVAHLTFSRNAAPNSHALYDTGQAVAQLVLQATALGLGVHQMAGFDRDRARDLLHIPTGYEPAAVLAVGHPGDAEQLSPALRERELAPRQRRPVSEWVRQGVWAAA